jgi:hypothetical protein
MHRALVLLGTLAVASLAPVLPARAQGRPAPAQPAPADEVSLKNGGLVRGTIVSLDPGKEVIITVQGTNQTRTIPWAEVDKVNRGGQATAPPPPPARPAPPAYGEPAAPVVVAPPVAPGIPVVRPGVGAPWVHVDADSDGVMLQRVDMEMAVVSNYGTAYAASTSPVCQAPCDRIVDGRKGQEFFFSGPGMPTSSSFQLVNRTGNVNVRVEGGSSAGRAGGGVLALLGLVGVVTGGTMLFVGAISSSNDITGGGGDSGKGLITAGGVTLAASAVALGGGIVLLVTSATKLHFPDRAKTTAQAAPRPGSPLLTLATF